MRTRSRAMVLDLRKEGLSYAEIGRRLGLSPERVRQIIVGVKRSHKKPDLDSAAVLTIGQASKLLGVHVNTLRRWYDEGIITTYRVGTGSQRRFRLEDVLACLRRVEMEG